MSELPFACRSHVHCFPCRNDEAFRKSLFDAFGEIDCPLGLAIGAQTGFPARARIPAELRVKCLHEEDTGVKVEGQPCKCNWIICRNPDAPICGEERVWWQSKCRKDRCRFYETSE